VRHILVCYRPFASRAADKIVTGSFQGMLRIYHPKQAGHQVDDLMLEASLDAPVLQLSAGRFIAYESHALAYTYIHISLIRLNCICMHGDEQAGDLLFVRSLHSECALRRNSSQIALAVLHPRKLSVFIVRAVGGSGSGGNSSASGAGGPSYLELSRQYDHKLERSAFNMCHGPFGGANGMFVWQPSIISHHRDFSNVKSYFGLI
jgi:Bardet-Biedl syndrome 9 protein